MWAENHGPSVHPYHHFNLRLRRHHTSSSYRRRPTFCNSRRMSASGLQTCSVGIHGDGGRTGRKLCLKRWRKKGNHLLCPVNVLKDLEKSIGQGSRAVIFEGRDHGFANRPNSSEEDRDAEQAFTLLRNWLHDGLVVEKQH